jgi:hypothetical protein
MSDVRGDVRRSPPVPQELLTMMRWGRPREEDRALHSDVGVRWWRVREKARRESVIPNERARPFDGDDGPAPVVQHVVAHKGQAHANADHALCGKMVV